MVGETTEVIEIFSNIGMPNKTPGTPGTPCLTPTQNSMLGYQSSLKVEIQSSAPVFLALVLLMVASRHEKVLLMIHSLHALPGRYVLCREV
jgi:hypothetical protein